MSTFFNQTAIPCVTIVFSLNGKDFTPIHGYIFGVLKPGDKISIGVEVLEFVNHKCYTLDSKMVATPKSAVRPGMYLKNLTVTESISDDGTRSTKIAGWPNNMFCLEIGGVTYNIGLFNQNGRYFFAIVERKDPINMFLLENADDENTPAFSIGTVVHADVLRGVARVYMGEAFQEARLHWSKMPIRKYGFRAVFSGEVLSNVKLEETGAKKTSFSQEVVSCKLA